MTTWLSDNVRPATGVIGRLADFNKPLHPDIEKAVERLNSIKNPLPATPNAAAEAIIAGKPVDEVISLLQAEQLAPALAAATDAARQIAARRLLNAVLYHAADLHEELRPDFEENKAKLEAVARDGNKTIETQIRSGDHKGAKLRAELPEIEIRLRDLYALRNAIWQVNSTTNSAGIDCSEWRRPLPIISDVRLATDDTPAAKWYNAIVAKGGELWWPTPDEWIREADKHVEELQRGELQRRQEWADLNRAIDVGVI